MQTPSAECHPTLDNSSDFHTVIVYLRGAGQASHLLKMWVAVVFLAFDKINRWWIPPVEDPTPTVRSGARHHSGALLGFLWEGATCSRTALAPISPLRI
jgi:hypothetical protein